LFPRVVDGHSLLMGLSPSEKARIEQLTSVLSTIPAREMRSGTTSLSHDEVALVQRGALEHPSARVRRGCLGVLDHFANDASVEVFRAAVLGDPVARVRVVALHGLACERCRIGELRVDETVAGLAQVLRDDPNPKVRHEAVLVLARLGRRDARVPRALAEVTLRDSDMLVRHVALAALEERGRDVRSRKALRRRARGQTGGRGRARASGDRRRSARAGAGDHVGRVDAGRSPRGC
jgi:HEAT repeat protein